MIIFGDASNSLGRHHRHQYCQEPISSSGKLPQGTSTQREEEELLPSASESCLYLLAKFLL